jgi:aspartate kinase
MKVFKFGGASVSTIDRIKNVAKIVESYNSEELVIIVSAMGKTTNALEKVVEAFYAGKKDEALQLFNVIKQSHLNTAKFLLIKKYNGTLEELVNFFTEVEWLLHDKPVRDYDYYYDQVVCIGELLSSCIVSAYLNEVGITNTWLDVRDILRTDENFRDANVDFDISAQNLQTTLQKQSAGIYVTQGFVGSTDENESTTLGREGSDYSAAIFANLLNAESLTIWKDVEGVMNADPKEFEDATLLEELSFTEVIEMAYYGAQVIHPKTIKPLQNKKIPLHVKSFIDPSLKGTVISSKNAKHLPSIKIVKPNQVLLHLKTRDFSFVGEKPISKLYQIFASGNMKPNLIQTGAISIQLCFDDRPDKIDLLASRASDLFDVQIEKGLNLLTIRHCKDDLLKNMTDGKDVVLIQQTKETVQVLYK